MMNIEEKRYEELVRAEKELSLLKIAVSGLSYDSKVETIKKIFAIKSDWEAEE